MRLLVLIPTFVVTLIGCNSLERSRLDREMRIQGVFLCPPQSIPRPTGESPDTAVARCSRDSVTVEGEELGWSRSFFIDSECKTRTIGGIEWVTPVKALRSDSLRISNFQYGPIKDRRLVRADYNWFMDQKAGCDLRKLPVNEPVKVGTLGNCAAIFPTTTGVASFMSEGKEGASRVVFDSKLTCVR